MPIHDWSEVDANLFHDFHQTWACELTKSLNQGLLPRDFSALLERNTSDLSFNLDSEEYDTPIILETKEEILAKMGNRISICRRLREVVSIIEIVSPGNKASVYPFERLIEKTHEFLEGGVNVLIVDLLPPTPRDPQGIHKAIWDRFNENEPFELPSDKPLTLAAYVAGDFATGISTRAYVEPVAVGDSLPDMPAYLDERHHIPIPLEATYQSAWVKCPADLRFLVEHGYLPEE